MVTWRKAPVKEQTLITNTRPHPVQAPFFILRKTCPGVASAPIGASKPTHPYSPDI